MPGDDVDQASALEIAQRERAIAAVRAKLKGDGSDDCADCGEPIPAGRRQAVPSATRCIACQALAERAR